MVLGIAEWEDETDESILQHKREADERNECFTEEETDESEECFKNSANDNDCEEQDRNRENDEKESEIIEKDTELSVLSQAPKNQVIITAKSSKFSKKRNLSDLNTIYEYDDNEISSSSDNNNNSKNNNNVINNNGKNIKNSHGSDDIIVVNEKNIEEYGRQDETFRILSPSAFKVHFVNDFDYLKDSKSKSNEKSNDNRQNKLDEALLNSGRVEDAMLSLFDWLGKAEAYLAPDQPTMGDLETVSILVDHHKAFEEELETKESVVSALQALPDLDENLKIKLDDLAEAWKRVKALSRVRVEKLKDAIRLVNT